MGSNERNGSCSKIFSSQNLLFSERKAESEDSAEHKQGTARDCRIFLELLARLLLDIFLKDKNKRLNSIQR